MTDAKRIATLEAALLDVRHHAAMIREACLFGRPADISGTAYDHASMIMRVADDATGDAQ